MKEPAVSVAMATYNGERFLQEQLDSLARQTLLPCELVVCDDGSTDGTPGILRRFAANAPFPVRIFHNPSRLGSGFNFLSALSRCTAGLVSFCDQDDIWLEKKLALCAGVMSDPKVSLVSHSAVVISTQPLARRMVHPNHRPSVLSSCGDLPVFRRTLPGFSMVLRRTVLEKVRVPDYSAQMSRWCVHDTWALVAALSCGRVVLMPDQLASYRLHDGNLSLAMPRDGRSRLVPDPCAFEHAAEVNAGVARFLQYALSFCDESALGTFREYIRGLERISGMYRDRARLHRQCGRRVTALATMAGMVAKGHYGSHGMKTRAFLRDLFLAALWSAGMSRTRETDEASVAGRRAGDRTRGQARLSRGEEG